MYATISRETGVVRTISWDCEVCEAEKKFQESSGERHLVVKIPQLMLDDLGRNLLAMWEEVSAE